jgi:hypothetical protein
VSAGFHFLKSISAINPNRHGRCWKPPVTCKPDIYAAIEIRFGTPTTHTPSGRELNATSTESRLLAKGIAGAAQLTSRTLLGTSRAAAT